MGKKKLKKEYRQQAMAWGNPYAMNDMNANSGMPQGLWRFLGGKPTEQFVIGALVGAAAVYVLGDEEMRAKLMKGVMKVYSGVAGGFEEMKEQMADIKAELAAEHRSGD